MKVRLITKTTGAENSEYAGKTLDEIIVAKARLSSSRDTNDKFKEPEKLIRYCITNGHWSIFDMANLGIEIETSRDIARQILRHFSIKPQEFSQRYAEVQEYEGIELRLESDINRQSSEVLLDSSKFQISTIELIKSIFDFYNILIKNKVSKETARFILPGLSTTKLALNGSIRSWITYLNLRLEKNTQKEHRLIAKEIKNIFIKELPIISKALFNFDYSYDIHILDQICLHKYEIREMILNKKGLVLNEY